MHPFFMYNHQVPRYTSYPTANHFSENITQDDYKSWLSLTKKQDALSLYIHIPYCAQLCWYCGCHTKITQKYEPIKKYLDYLKKEILLVNHALQENGLVTHIHFGGGSPTILDALDFADLVSFIKDSFHVAKDANIDIEIDPRQITEAKIAAYAKSGVTRASIGVQDFHPHVQKAIGRPQAYASVYDTVHMLRDYNIQEINFDLIYGLPHQTPDLIRDNIDFALMFKPNRIAFFGYAHVPWMKKHMRMIDETALPDEELRFEMFQIASKRLEDNGYMAIGLDHFVLNDDAMADAYKSKKLGRNFQGYTIDSADKMIGLGVSSIGKTVHGYVQNISSNGEYYQALDQDILPVKRGIATSQQDIMIRDIIEQLMCYFDVDLNKVAQKYSVSVSEFDRVCNKIKIMAQHDLADVDNYHITVSHETRQIVRIICSYFDEYFKASLSQHAKAS